MADPQAREGATDQMAPETTEATNEIAGERDAGSPVGASDTFTTAEVRAPIGNRRWDSIRVRLAYLVLACVVPVWIAAGFLVYRNYQSKRALTEQRMLETARALTMVVDRELANMQAGLNVLASLDTLVSGDLPAIYRAAQKVKQAHPDSNVVLSLATGKELVNLNLPLGARFPLRDPDITRQVFATGKPFITSVYKGPVTGRLNFSVDAPVFRNGRVVYDLAMILPVDHVAAILSQQHLPPEWIGTIIGNDNVVVARTRFPEQIVGRIATPDLLQHTAKTAEGTAEIFNIEGTSVLDSFSRSAITGWTVAIGVPKAVVMAEIWRWLAWTIAGTALLSLTGIGLALLMARRIAGSIQGLIAPVLALGRGESVAIRHFQLTEFDEAAKSLVKASQLVQQRTVEHERAEARREAEGLKQFSVELGRSEAAARTRATELATIMDAEPTVTLVAHDPECQRMTSNRTGYDLLRLPPGANISKSVPESERSSNYRLLRDGRELSPDELPMQLAAATGREVRDCEYTVAFDDGSSRSIFGNAVPLLDERGRVRGAVGAFIDITERKRAEAVLEEREQHLRTILQTTQEAFYLVDVQGNLLDVNDAYCEMSSYTREELLQMRVQELECVENEQEVAAHAQRIIRQGRDRFESQHRRKDGQIIEVESSITFQDIRGGQFVCFLRDITGRKRAEEQLYKLNRTLQAIRNTQQALLHATDESALLERICGIITRDCGHAMMWIGFAEDDRDKTVRIVASAGFDEGYLESVQLTWADTERGRGTSGTAIRTGKVSIIRDLRSEPNAKPWREELMKRGYGSCLSLPLMDKGKVFGTLTIYSKELDAFSEDEVKLLSELADELAYGIGALRMRVARVQAEEKVRESQELLEVFVAQAPVGLAMFDRNMRYVRASNKWCEDKGLEQDTIQGKSHYDLFPDLPEHWKEAHRCSLAGQCVWNDDDQVTLNGKTITARWKIHPWGDSGCETGGIIIFIEDITAWKRAEARISHLASFPELNPYPIIETDLKGKIAYANPSALRVFPDLIQSGQTHALLRNWPSIVESFKTGNERQTTSEIEINGAVYLQSIYYVPTLNVLRAYMMDITERRSAEQILRESEERFRLLLNSTAESIFGLDTEGNCTFCNSACLRSLGYQAPEDLHGKNMHKLMHHSYVDRTSYPQQECPICVASWQGKASHLTDEVFWRADGTSFPAEYWSYPMHKGGELIGAVVSFLDISDRHRAERDLRQSEEKHRRLFENVTYGVYRSRVDGTLVEVNPSLVAMLGYGSKEELLSCNLDSDVYENPEERSTIIERCRLTGRVDGVEVKWRRRDGKIIDVRLSGRMNRGGDGNTGEMEVVVDDITERRMLEQQLRQAQKMEAIGRLAGGIAHDFNNLLMVIQSYTEMLQDSLPVHDRLRRNTQEIMKAADRATSLTRQMLAYSRKQILSPVVLDLNAVVNDTAKMLKRLIGEDIELRVSSAESLWAIEADSDQMAQVLMNLSVNARDAMPQGGTLTIATGNVTVEEGSIGEQEHVPPGDYVWLSVTDTGTGISKELQGRIFDPFFTTKEVGQGTGLGLASVYGIVKQSGGYVCVDSEVGQGACFTVYLPRVKQAIAPADMAAETEAQPRGTGTILVAEDEEALREAICGYLSSLGYTVLGAGSGKEALSVASQHEGHIDLLITDLVMPGMSGKELSQMMGSLRPDLKTICMSGYSDDEVSRHGINELGAAFLQKPFNLGTLARKVRDTLGRTETVQ